MLLKNHCVRLMDDLLEQIGLVEPFPGRKTAPVFDPGVDVVEGEVRPLAKENSGAQIQQPFWGTRQLRPARVHRASSGLDFVLVNHSLDHHTAAAAMLNSNGTDPE